MDMPDARGLVLRYGWNAAAFQILNPGVQRWFSAADDAVVGYSEYSRTRVVVGAPVCADDRLAQVVAEFETDAAREGSRVVYFGAGSRLEHLAANQGGYAFLLLGAQPVWDPREWSATVRSKQSLRAQLNRAFNKRVSVSEWPAEKATGHPALERVLHEWLATRGLPPLHFMTEANILGALEGRRIFVATQPPTGVIAFLVATPVPLREGWLVEQWPRLPSAPNGTTHVLVDAAMRAFGESGSRYATLGLAPLSDRTGEPGRGQQWWLRVLLNWMRAHGQRFYNFRGLDSFKASLQPRTWEPIYAISRGRRVSVGTLRAVAGVFGGGSPIGLIARALVMATAREVRIIGRAVSSAARRGAS
jgi:phosphatidylglycerol lysyltransferase